MHTRKHGRGYVSWPPLAALAILATACSDQVAAPSPTPDFDVIGGEDVNQVFVVTNTNDAGAGSLRQAIEDANAFGGTDGIAFEIAGPGPHTIQPASPLPPVFDPVIIDGYTQAGSGANTNGTSLGSNAAVMVELDGSLVGPSGAGLVIVADGSTVRGLAVNRFQDGIVVAGSGNKVQGSLLGTDVVGGAAAPNLANGVVVLGADNLVGGSTPAERNVISGNLGDGVLIIGPGAVRNQVAGNYLGTDATGAAALPNGRAEPDPNNSAGVHIISGASDNLVGGPSSMPATCDGPCNVISGNHRSGVWVEDQANGNVVQGNLVGTDAGGWSPLGNYRFGVFLGGVTTPVYSNVVVSNRIQWNGRDGVALFAGSSQNRVGGMAVTPGDCDGTCNRIAFNGQRFDTGGDGVRVFANAGTGNSVLGNSISEHPRGEGIDVGAPGLTFNDPGDFDVGANGLQNYPELTSASARPGHLVVSGTIDTPDPASVLIELYANPVPTPGADPSGFGEGAVFLGRTAPDAQGGFTVRLDPVPEGTLIAATATDSQGNTSEFSANIEALPGRGPDSEGHAEFFPFSTTFWTCTEPVRITGSFHQEFRFTPIGAGRYQYTGHINAIGIGVGETTGAVYNWNDAINDQAVVSFTSPQQTFTSLQNLRLIGRGDAADLRLTARFHMTVTPEGVVHITADDFSVDCG